MQENKHTHTLLLTLQKLRHAGRWELVEPQLTKFLHVGNFPDSSCLYRCPRAGLGDRSGAIYTTARGANAGAALSSCNTHSAAMNIQQTHRADNVNAVHTSGCVSKNTRTHTHTSPSTHIPRTIRHTHTLTHAFTSHAQSGTHTRSHTPNANMHAHAAVHERTHEHVRTHTHFYTPISTSFLSPDRVLAIAMPNATSSPPARPIVATLQVSVCV